ncbi:MAG: hypothetical protein E7562_00825 [Ruminococcaceae bacterium]|nr:hypothetical protein [Oscillospiraceae bacterium]
MKKIISLVLAVCLIVTTLCSVTITSSAATTISNITVDLTKSVRIGADETNLSMSQTYGEDGSMAVTFSIYNDAKLFMSGDAIKTDKLWLSGAMYALKDSSDNFIILQKGATYAINVIYDVTSAGTTDTTYVPQIGLGYNNHSSNTTIDNGTFMLAANKNAATGSYSLSVTTTPTANQPLRLHFGGHGAATIKSITIKQASYAYDVKAADLTNVAPISVSNASHSNFTAATASAPLSVDVNATYAYNGTLFDGTNTWINHWTTMYLKTMIPLKYDAENYVVADSNKSYKITVKYKVTATPATKTEDYPELGIVYNIGYNLNQDNGSKVIAAQRIAPGKVNAEQTLTTTFEGSKYGTGHPIRLALTGKGSFEISSVTIEEYTKVVPVTLTNSGIKTVDIALIGDLLPTPVKAGYEFKGWFDANGIKHTNVVSSLDITAAWTKTGNVDLTATDMISVEKPKATMTLDVPTDASSALGVTIQGFDGILMDKENNVVHTGTVYTGGAAVSLEYSNDNYVGLDSTAKYVVNVEYDVTNIGTYDKQYHPQIAILYNVNTTTQDNGQYICAAKKHSETVDNASISCVIDGVYAKALRLAFDGQGSFNIKSVTVTEIPAGTLGLVTVKYTDNTYSTDVTAIAESGSVIVGLPRTLLHNFGGWYNGEEKVTSVSADAALNAKWFDKFDVTMDDSTNVKDLVRIKKVIANNTDELLYDTDRDNAVAASDTIALRKNLLGIETVTINGNELATYTVSAGGNASF